MSEKFLIQSVTDYGKKALRLYANEVNLDRATPDLIDGLKPVARRIAWGASQTAKTTFVKSAQIVGHVMGCYHPHGDASLYGAMVTMVQSCVPLLHGSGNWGNLIDSAAAMRYTESRLSAFGRTGFDANYTNKEVTSFVPNYDDSTVEPVSIPFPLPVILFNGGEGIGYGTACSIPSFTPESVVVVLKKLLDGEKLKPLDFAKLMKPDYRWGGTFVSTKENKKAWLQMFESSKASVLFESHLIVDQARREVTINEWPAGLNPEKFTEWVKSLPETLEASPTKGSAEITIVMGRGYNTVQFEAFVKKIQQKTRVKASYNINVTRREAVIVDGVVDYKVELLSLSVPQLVIEWLRARLKTEIKSLEYRIRKQDELIAYSELLIYAAQNLDVIVPIIRKSEKPREDLARKLKISLAQADQILDLTLRKLTRLDQDSIKQVLKDQQQHLKQLKQWLAKPKKKMATDIDEAMKAIEADRAYILKVKTQKLEIA